MKIIIAATKHCVLYAFVVIFAAANDVLVACPNCKEGFDVGTEQAGVGAAYSLTIGLLLLVPMTVIAVIIYKVRRQMLAHGRRQQQAQFQELREVSTVR
jgi:hypothetical protein